MTETQKDINEIKEGGKEKANVFSCLSSFQADITPSSELYRTFIHSSILFFKFIYFCLFGVFSHLDAQHLKCRDYVCLDSQRLAPCLTVNKMWLNKFLEGLIYPTLRNYLGSSNLEVLVNIWIGFLWLKFDRLDKQISDKIWSK